MNHRVRISAIEKRYIMKRFDENYDMVYHGRKDTAHWNYDEYEKGPLEFFEKSLERVGYKLDYSIKEFKFAIVRKN